MPSTYSPSLRLELIGAGEQAGTWNTTTNTNLGTLLDQAIAGYTTVSVTSANQAFTALDGAADESRNAVIELTTTTTAAFAVYAPPQEKTYIIYNNTAYVATVYNSTVLGNTTAAGTGVTVAAGSKLVLFTNGTNFLTLTVAAPGGNGDVVGPASATGNNLVAFDGTSGKLIKQAATVTIAQGGTGTTSTAYCSLSSNVSGTLPVANGGTGSSSLAAAGIITTSGGQTISGSLSTTGFINTNSAGLYTNELFINTVTSLGGYNAKGNLLFNGATQSGFVMQTSASPAVNMFLFLNSSGTLLGSIYINPAANSVTFNDLSDYRLKHSIAPMTGALAKVAQLKPCTFKWKNNDVESQGFIAHELQEVVKECVTGKKDDLNEDGSIKAQGVDTRKLVATLTAAIQELKALVDAQAARITALES
jgi:Chaperone of endosialidase